MAVVAVQQIRHLQRSPDHLLDDNYTVPFIIVLTQSITDSVYSTKKRAEHSQLFFNLKSNWHTPSFRMNLG